MYGLAGDVVRQVRDYSEASHVGILATFLSAAGVLMGRDRYYEISGAAHRMNVNVLLAGTTSKGRKGTTVAPVERILNAADLNFTGEHIESSLVSGAGLIERVRDPDPVDVKDPHSGVADQRLWVVESEFAGALRRAAREGNDLSERIREAWDSRPLSSLARAKNRLRSSRHHIAIVGHITPSELRLRATESDIAGGTLNRFLPILVERSQWLPDPEPIPPEVISRFGRRLQACRLAAVGERGMRRDREASELWNSSVYKELHPELRDGPLAKVIGGPSALRRTRTHHLPQRAENTMTTTTEPAPIVCCDQCGRRLRAERSRAQHRGPVCQCWLASHRPERVR
jgi:hypothetical protein